MQQSLPRKLLAEYLGSLLLAALVIGSGIAAQRLSPHDTGLQLTENAAATAAGLFPIILMFGPVSGAHFNPVVSFVDAAFGGLPWRHALAYLPVQVGGCVSGAVLANLMFSTSAVSISTTRRATVAHGLSEIVATVGLLLVIFSLARSGRAERAPAAVGAYIGAAYWFTSSTGFANPSITIGRMFSDTFEPPPRPYHDVPPRASTGHGATEAPRGLLYHRYTLDAQGTLTNANIVPRPHRTKAPSRKTYATSYSNASPADSPRRPNWPPFARRSSATTTRVSPAQRTSSASPSPADAVASSISCDRSTRGYKVPPARSPRSCRR